MYTKETDTEGRKVVIQAIHYFDRILTQQVLRLPDFVRPFMLFMTLVGQPVFTVGFAAALIGYGVASDTPGIAIAGGYAVMTVAIASILKITLRRNRPDNDYVRSMILQTFSFPSGHAAGSLACYGAVAYVVALLWPALLVPAYCITIFLTFFIGISRVYLGAHYPSDVIGGWIVGSIGFACIILSGAAL